MQSDARKSALKAWKKTPAGRASKARWFKRWKKTVNGRASLKKARAKWEDLNREKHLAHRKVEMHVLRGVLQKPDNCQSCGIATPKDQLHGHHHDYSKPLDVEWICWPCHVKEHRNERVS